MSRLSISLLGSFQVALDGEPITGFATDKALALLAYLSVEADRAHSREVLAGLLWPDRPGKRALQSLRQALYDLRQAIEDGSGIEQSGLQGGYGGPLIIATRYTIQFNTQSDHWLDVAALTILAEACRRHRHRHRSTCLPCLHRMERMVALYRGEFLERFVAGDSPLFEEWVLLQREWLHQEVMDALVHLADHHERRGEIDQARRYARRQVQMEPWREEAHRQLMRLLALGGQRSAALAQYGACRQALQEELGVEPTGRTTALYEGIRRDGTPPPPHRSTVRPPRLPPSPTAFVGREEELADLAELLANPDCRLLTLVGPGGVGKTRLALEAAAQQTGTFRDGVAFVPLASVSSAQLLTSAIADALAFSFHEGEEPEQQLLDYLRDRSLLLVLDSMEHILEGARFLARLLHLGRDIVVLVTSQEKLNLREEWVRAIGGLAYPQRGERDPSQGHVDASEYGAIQLFHQQARQRQHHLVLSPDAAADVMRICQLVDGLPLGIELAAAWTGARSCREIARELERNLDLLSTTLRNVPVRQRSIRATLDHSWRLLSSAEKDLLARLSVFRGGFQDEAALQVTDASLSTLLALMDKSLIHRVAPDRCDIHGLLSRYAAEKLDGLPRHREEMEIRHAKYFAALLEGQREGLREGSGEEALALLTAEIENIRQAWQQAVIRDRPQLIEQSLESLYLFYDGRCRFQEGIDLFAHAAERWAHDPGHRRLLGKIAARQGRLYLRLGLHQQAHAALEHGLKVSRQLDIHSEQVFCLVHLAKVALKQGEYAEGRRLAVQSLALSRRVEDCWGRTHSLLSLGLAHYRAGDIDQAERLLEQSLAVARETDDPRLVVVPLNQLADIACHRGHYARGLALFEECLALSRELGNDYRVAVILNDLGTLFHVLGQVDEAQSSYQDSLDICSQIGDPEGQAIALSNLGELAYAAGEHAQAETLYRQALRIGRDAREPWVVMACLNNLGEAIGARGDCGQAQVILTEALTIAWETQTLPMVLKVLMNLAVVFDGMGEADRAAELLALVSTHPSSEQVIQLKARELLDAMDAVPPGGVHRSLDTVVEEARTRAGRGQIPVHPSE